MTTEAELSDDEFDKLWDEDSDDTVPKPAPAEPEPGAAAESVPGQPDPEKPAPIPAEDSDALRQRLKSAEGRLKVFEDQVGEMRNRLAQTEGPEPEPEPEPETVLPEGWTKEDWDDYQSDNPVGAELHQQQNREVQQLKEQLGQSVAEQERDKLQREFNTAVMVEHPDYLELLETKRDDIQDFIKGETNPLLKETYGRIYEQGNAEQVSQLVSAYKSARSDGSQNEKQRLIDNATAVPGRPPQPAADRTAGLPGESDYDAAWDYFSDEAID